MSACRGYANLRKPHSRLCPSTYRPTVREMGRLELGGSLFGEEVLEDVGGLDSPYWRPRENGGSALSIR